jgi:proton glutamate symport protein
LEGLALILAVDAFMDMGRSAINLLGNCLATAVIARSEGLALGQPGTSGSKLEQSVLGSEPVSPLI